MEHGSRKKKTPPFCNGGDSLLGILANHILRGDTRATIKGLIQYREQPFAIRYCVDIGWDFQHSHIPNSVKLIPCPLLFQLYRLC